MSDIVRSVFEDIDTKKYNNLTNSSIEKINLFKKAKRIEINLKSSTRIFLSELEFFEQYLQKKFSIEEINLNIKYKTEIKADLKADWPELVKYIYKKNPLTKTMLKTSSIDIKDNLISIEFTTKSADFLRAYKLDKILTDLLQNLYGKKYKIMYLENINIEDKTKQITFLKQLEKEVCKEISLKNEEVSTANKKTKKEDSQDKGEIEFIFGRRKNINEEIIKIKDINLDYLNIAIEGEVVNLDIRKLKIGKTLITFDIYDGTSTIVCKAFVLDKDTEKVAGKIKNSSNLRILGKVQYDTYSKEIVIMANVIVKMPAEGLVERTDSFEEKRIELHAHTQMSQLDGIGSAKDLIAKAKEFGMTSIAITDHGVVQAFPEARKASKEYGVKVIYGTEAYIVPEGIKEIIIPDDYCVIDIETTGLSYRTNKIIELGAVKVRSGKIVEEFNELINPEENLSDAITKITKISDDMLVGKEKIDKVLARFLDFIADDVLIAHNANFDIGFIKYNCEKLKLKFENNFLDSLQISRKVFPELKKHKQEELAKHLDIEVIVAHRALDDVLILQRIIEKIKEKIEKEGYSKEDNYKSLPIYHAVILVKNRVGLINLYKLISESHLNYYHYKPRMPKKLYKKYSEGLMIGSACDQGELYKAIIENRRR